MAKKELARFCLEYLPGHPDVRATVDAIVDRSQFARAMVDAGAKVGFVFTEGEVTDVMEPSGGVGGELSDAQLQRVAGGRAGGSQVKYMEIKLKEVMIT